MGRSFGQLGAEEVEGTLAGFVGGFGVVVGALVTIEAVAGVVIKKERKVRIGLLDFLNFRSGDVLVFRAEMQHDGAMGAVGKEF